MIPKPVIVCLILLFALFDEVASQKFDAEILKYSTFCEVQKNNLSQTDSVTIQINNRIGDKYTEISIPYSKSEKVSNISAWIENIDGLKIRDLKKSDIIDKSAISEISLYEDNFNKCFQLKHNVYPYKVIYTYKTTFSNFISIAWWAPIIHGAIPTRDARLKVKIPKNVPFCKYVKGISGFSMDSAGTNVLLEWKAIYDKPQKAEIFSQPENLKTYVIVTPLYFNYGVEGCLKDWNSYGNWQYRLIQGLDVLPDNEKDNITALIKGNTEKREIIKILYHYLQDHTRYINVSIGIGGLKPYPASYVVHNKYGDCKALTNYLKAMLSYAGIESFYTNVYASDQPRDIITGFAGPLFNHIVLAVPLKDDTVWLECTSNTNPFGYMGTFTQNRQALLVSKDNSRLVKIPALKKEDDLVSYNLLFDLRTTGNANVTLNISFKGQDFEMFNQLHSEFNGDEKDRIIRQYMPFENYEVINWNLKKLHRDTARIELNATLNLYKLLKPLGNEYYFSLYPIRIPPFSNVANRVLPVVLPFPIYVSDTLSYKMPNGYELKTKLDTISIETKFGNYKLALNVNNGKIVVIKRFELFPGSYTIEQYPGLYDFIQSVKNIDEKKIIIKPII
jgi:hypothetical protein